MLQNFRYIVSLKYTHSLRHLSLSYSLTFHPECHVIDRCYSIGLEQTCEVFEFPFLDDNISLSPPSPHSLITDLLTESLTRLHAGNNVIL